MSNKKLKPPSAKSIRFSTPPERPESTVTTTNIHIGNGEVLPVQDIIPSSTARPPRLPKIQRPPTGHQTNFKQKKKSTSPKKVKQAVAIKEKSVIEQAMEDKAIERLQTPDLLGCASFNYLESQYCYEAETELDTGRLALASRKGKRIKGLL